MPRLKLICCIPICLLALLLFGCSPASVSSNVTAEKAKDTIPAFNEIRAFNALKKQVEFGPRVPGMPGHDATAEYIISQLKPYSDVVQAQDFTETIKGKTLKMQNIIAFFNKDAKKWVLLAAHWDTRPTADYEVDRVKRNTPIPGANDGASGVAVLLELARVFAQQKPDVGVVMVFFDGEDYPNSMFMGSKYFADNIKKTLVLDNKPISLSYGILLDMVGDKDLNIYQEVKSVEAAPEIVNKVWSNAKKLGYESSFIPTPKYSIQDDHIPLISAGVKCIDIIDFDYAPWHTLADNIDKCSPKSLKIVGDVVAYTVYGEKP